MTPAEFDSIAAAQKLLEAGQIRCTEAIAEIHALTQTGQCTRKEIAPLHAIVVQHFGERERHAVRCRAIGALKEAAVLNYEIDTAHDYLEYLALPYYRFLWTHVAPVLDIEISAFWPTPSVFAEVQWLIRRYQRRKARELRKAFDELGLPTSGFKSRLSPPRDYLPALKTAGSGCVRLIVWIFKTPLLLKALATHFFRAMM